MKSNTSTPSQQKIKESILVPCSVCGRLFYSEGLASCPAHSFGDLLTEQQKRTSEALKEVDYDDDSFYGTNQ